VALDPWSIHESMKLDSGNSPASRLDCNPCVARCPAQAHGIELDSNTATRAPVSIDVERLEPERDR